MPWFLRKGAASPSHGDRAHEGMHDLREESLEELPMLLESQEAPPIRNAG